MTSSRDLLLLSVCTLGLAAGCRPEGAPVFPKEDRLLEQLMETYVSARFEFYPVESTLAGFPGHDDRLGSYARVEIDERVEWLSDFHFRLMGVRLTELSEASYLDAMWLTSLVKAELFELSERKLWEKSAAFYADRACLGIFALVVEADLDQRVDALNGRLDEVRQLMSQARENLGGADPLWIEDGAQSLIRCRDLIAALPELIGTRLDAVDGDAWLSRQRAAEASIRELLEALFALQGERTAPAAFALGEDALRTYFRNEHLVDWPLEEIRSRADRARTRAEHALGEHALENFPALSVRDLLALPAAGLPERVVAATERTARPLSLDPTLGASASVPAPFPTRLAPPYFPVREAVTLWRPRALEPRRGAFLLVRSELPFRRASRAELTLLTLREAGGRSRQHEQQAASTSLLRRVLASAVSREAWLGRFEARALASGFEQEDTQLRLVHHHRRLLETLRLIAVIELHARGAGLEAVAMMFEDRGYLAPPAARAEAIRVAVDPGSATAGLARLLMDDLEAELGRVRPLDTADELTEAVLRVGSLPMRLIRFHLLEPRKAPLLD